jgi:hypothetical protein
VAGRDLTGPREVIPLTGLTFVQGAQMAEGVGSGATPADPALLEPLVDHRLARCFDVSRADLPAFFAVAGVVHPREIVPHLSRHEAVRLLRRGGSPHEVQRFQGRQERAASFVFQLVALLCAQCWGRVGVAAEIRLGESAEVFGRVSESRSPDIEVKNFPDASARLPTVPAKVATSSAAAVKWWAENPSAASRGT